MERGNIGDLLEENIERKANLMQHHFRYFLYKINVKTFYVSNQCGTISKKEPYKVVQVMKRSSCLDMKFRRTWG